MLGIQLHCRKDPATRTLAQQSSGPARLRRTCRNIFEALETERLERFRIRSVGDLPHVTTWINSAKIAELDTKMQSPGWDPKAVLEKIGRAGHIALEVHSNGPTDPLGKDRWAPGAVCRWCNISIKTLTT